MNAWETVRLIAGREVRQRLRSRLFVVSTVALAVLMTGAAALPGLLGVIGPDVVPDEPSGPAEPLSIGVLGSLGEVERDAIEEAVGPVEVITLEEEAGAEALLVEDRIDVAVVPGERVLVPPSSGALAIEPFEAGRIAEALALVAALEDDADRVAEVLGTAPLPVERVGDGDGAEAVARLIVANVALVFLFGVLIMYSSMIINGVIEEKGSRVVELLVEAVPVRQLMSGKLLGLGLIGLAQTLTLFAPPLVVLVLTAQDLVPPDLGGLVGAIALWFVLGYGLYAVVAASLGSLVSRPEEAQAVLVPANVLMVTGYFVGFVVINAPEGGLARVASLVPFTAPYAMVVRQALAPPPLWEILLAVALTVVTIAAVTILAARIYEGGIMRVGARVRLRDAWGRANR